MTQDALVAIPTPPTRPAPRQRRQHPAEHLATRKHWRGIRATWCRDCKTPILTGLDSDECALQARVDATPLTAIGEALALLAGAKTYEVRAGRPVRIVRRDAHTITARPAGGDRRLAYDVVAEHTCGQPTPDALVLPSRHQPAASAAAAFDPTLQPPF